MAINPPKELFDPIKCLSSNDIECDTAKLADTLCDMIEKLDYTYNLALNIYDLDSKLSILTSRVNVLEDEMAEAKQHITNLLNRMSDLETIVSNISFDNVYQQINNVSEEVMANTLRINSLTTRVDSIEGAIFDWATDKTTKIPRGTINLYTGSSSSPSETSNYIKSHSGVSNYDIYGA
jgi:predicted  nucleic acid-binding Zn-ribbon protein